MKRKTILYRLPFAQGLAMYCWAIANDPWINSEQASPGYIAQEIDDLMNQ